MTNFPHRRASQLSEPSAKSGQRKIFIWPAKSAIGPLTQVYTNRVREPSKP